MQFAPSTPTGRRGGYLHAVARHALRAAGAVSAFVAGSALAAELIVVDQPGCPYRERFEREIAPAWPNTDEGRDVPLRRVALHGDWPADLAAVDRAALTPTFILVEQGEERGRLVGYAGDEHFWFLIGRLLERAVAEAEPAESVANDEAGETRSTD